MKNPINFSIEEMARIVDDARVDEVLARPMNPREQTAVALGLSVAKWDRSRGNRRGKGVCAICRLKKTPCIHDKVVSGVPSDETSEYVEAAMDGVQRRLYEYYERALEEATETPSIDHDASFQYREVPRLHGLTPRGMHGAPELGFRPAGQLMAADPKDVRRRELVKKLLDTEEPEEKQKIEGELKELEAVDADYVEVEEYDSSKPPPR